MMISWWSKHVGVILNVLMCDIWINVLLSTKCISWAVMYSELKCTVKQWNTDTWFIHNVQVCWWFVTIQNFAAFLFFFFLRKAKETISLKSQSFDNRLQVLRSSVRNVLKRVSRVQTGQAIFFLYFFPAFFASFPFLYFSSFLVISPLDHLVTVGLGWRSG
jgi:hypothetical protein